MRGRKPTPTAVKIARGNPGKRPLPVGEPRGDTSVDDGPPDWMTVEARQFWTEAAGRLRKSGVLTVDDLSALTVASEIYGQWLRASRTVAEQGETIEVEGSSGQTRIVERPEVAVAARARMDLLRYLVEFGMTPSSRARLKVDPQTAEDPLEAFLKLRA